MWIHALFAVLPISCYFWLQYRPVYDKISIDEDGFWIHGTAAKDDETMHVFNVAVADEKIERLKERVREAQLPPHDSRDTRGQLMDNMSIVMQNFDWKQHQHFLNTFKQYKTEIEGLGIHFVRVSVAPSKDRDVVPILLIHGFPGSYWDFFKLIPILSNPVRFGFDFGVHRPFSFEVIVPSLPGFIFSDKPDKRGIGSPEIARILSKLMSRLDLKSYFVYGTEKLGADVATWLAAQNPESVRGLQVSNAFVSPLYSPHVFVANVISSLKFDKERSSTTLYDYFTLPHFNQHYPIDTLEYSVTDSVVGLAAFLLDEWRLLSNRVESHVELNEQFTLDELATLVHLYWLTGTTRSAMRIVTDSYRSSVFEQPRIQVPPSVPVGLLQSPDCPWHSARNVFDYVYLNVSRHAKLPRGGVFHHLQDAQSTAAEIFRFVEFIVA